MLMTTHPTASKEQRQLLLGAGARQRTLPSSPPSPRSTEEESNGNNRVRADARSYGRVPESVEHRGHDETKLSLKTTEFWAMAV